MQVERSAERVLGSTRNSKAKREPPGKFPGVARWNQFTQSGEWPQSGSRL